ncbi:hypothetical protein ACOTVX_11785, partial [Aliarcobacter butzleri]
KDVLNEFETLCKTSTEVNDEFLTLYSNFLNTHNKEFKSFSLNQIKANSMQEKALERLEDLRNKGENKALIIAATGT